MCAPKAYGCFAVRRADLRLPAGAQVDPLLFLKTAAPNILFIVDTANRMQRDAATDLSTPTTASRRATTTTRVP